MRAGGLPPATRRCRARRPRRPIRSMRAGGLPPATLSRARSTTCSPPTFNEGRGVTPGNALGAHHRPLSVDRRSMRAGGLPPATPDNTSDIEDTLEERSMRAGGLPPATPGSFAGHGYHFKSRSMRAGGLPPATQTRAAHWHIHAPRSMRAGGLPPATPNPESESQSGPPAFNEGRGVTPGNA